MSPLALAQLTDVQRAVQEHFQRGGSTWTVLILLAILAGIIMTAHLLTRRQERRRGTVIVSDPMALYRDLLAELDLTKPQCKLLERAAKEARLAHPTVILLSPRVFARHVEARSTSHNRATTQTDDRLIAQLKKTLFPPPPGDSTDNPSSREYAEHGHDTLPGQNRAATGG